MPRRRTPNLRAMLTAAAILVMGSSLAIAAALLVITGRMRDTAVGLTWAVESVHLAERAQTALLLYSRAADPLTTASLRERLRTYLEQASGYVSNPREGQALAHARLQLDSLFQGADGAGREAAAYSALEALVNVNIHDARRFQARATELNEFADLIAVLNSIALVGITVLALWWLRSRAFQPIFRIADAMDRFGKGERAARAPETGPPEFRDMAARFNEMATALAVQQGAQTAFLGGVAHDLRTPLGVLMLQMDIVRPDRPLPPEPLIRRTVAMVTRQIGRMDRMLGDLLQAAKIDSGTLELYLVDQDLSRLVVDAANLFQESSPEHEVRVTVPDQTVPVRCDPLRIEQVITNLLSNAIKYSPGGGCIHVELGLRGAEAVVAVTDPGVGISADDQRRLFEPFRRVGLSTENIPGVGLGLFVVKKIVDMHRGHIDLESIPGKGSTFRVCLPVSEPGSPTRA